MFNELSTNINHFLSKGKDFAIAQIINRIEPSSGKVGDKAIVLESGELIGWIGGGCVRGIVIKEAINVIKTKRHMRVRISPEGGSKESSNFKEYIMSCQSKGTIEVLIEPVIPQPELIIVGKSKIAQKLALLAATASFKVKVMTKESDTFMFPNNVEIINHVDFEDIKVLQNNYIIVATQGDDDELSVAKALKSNASYVGFIASKKKSEDVKKYLQENKISQDRIDSLRSPVGLDINAKLASEVAISILAEVIEDFRKNSISAQIEGSCCGSTQNKIVAENNDAPSKFEEDYYINPVCDVPVSKKNPKHIVPYKGENVYFCCDGCKVKFEENPAQYMKA